MARIDFGEVKEPQDFSRLPEGRYLSTLVDVKKTLTKNGDDMLKLRFEIQSGPHRGGCIFDNMSLSEKAKPRAKLILSALGLDVTRALDLTPALLAGRSCYVTVESEEYLDPQGKTKRSKTVAFKGYERAEGKPATAPPAAKSGGAQDEREDDLPF